MIVGAEHVSFSAVATLAHGGASTEALVTELPRHQSLGLFRAGARVRFRAPLLTRSRVTAINGTEGRVEEVEVTELDSGRVRRIACDLVVFTADWVPDHELAAMAGIELDRGTLGPGWTGRCGPRLPASSPPATSSTPPRPPTPARSAGATPPPPSPRTSRARHGWPDEHVRVLAGEGLRWVVPGLIAPGEGQAPRDRFLLRSADDFATAADRGRPGRALAMARPAAAPDPGALGPHPVGLGLTGGLHGGPRDG